MVVGTAQEEVNGSEGMAEKFLPAAINKSATTANGAAGGGAGGGGRYVVVLGDGRRLGVKPENLIEVLDP
jgi:hypothetical protein